MYGLRLLVRVPIDKRHEFIDTLTSTGSSFDKPPCRTLVMQELDDRNLFCWMGDWQALDGLQAFLRSDDYRALKGAAEVLGTLEDVWIAEGGTT